jgi:hypothetical protein
LIALIVVVGILVLLVITLILVLIVRPYPESEKINEREMPVITGPSSSRLGNSWFRHSRSGLWELYTEGLPFARGFATGRLTRELVRRQEEIFVKEVRKIVNSPLYLFILKIIVALMNRRLPHFIGREYCSEIHGVSLSAPHEFRWIGPDYQRMLNYHAAHDIGHTLQSFKLVGCTAFAVKDTRSKEGKLLLGRNFDFYVGDEFSKEKIISFCRPHQGYRYASITWGGMVGCASGMNEHGLAVVVNGAKSEFPNRCATPVSILLKEVLQYTRTIDEALELIKSRKIFVSESLVIASAADRRAVSVEKSRSHSVLLEAPGDQLVVTNHFQSEALRSDPSNVKYMNESPSVYRYQRVEELLGRYSRLGVADMAAVLRDRFGKDDLDIGQGNEMAVDQLLAHHSVIFSPEDGLMWVSCGPYPEGEYSAYDLKKIFESGANTDETEEIISAAQNIPAAPYLGSEEHQRFILYKQYLAKFGYRAKAVETTIDDEHRLIATNPESYLTYSTLGDYFFKRKDYEKARHYWETGVTKQCPNLHELEHMQKGLLTIRKKSRASANAH